MIDDAAVICAHLESPPPLVTKLKPELPRAIDDVIASAMAKDPKDRPTTAAELMDAAARALETSVGPNPRPPRIPRWVALAMVPLILGGASYAASSSRSADARDTTPGGYLVAGGLRLDAPAGWVAETPPKLPGLKFGPTGGGAVESRGVRSGGGSRHLGMLDRI